MPIRYEDTHLYVQKTLPSANTLNFIINGLPTKTGNIWRGLVDLDKVYKALDWLIENNILYKDVRIDMALKCKGSQMLNEDAIDDKIGETNNLVMTDDDLQSYLTKIEKEPLNHLTVLDIDKINENISDIDKYAMNRIITEPLKDRDINMDHLCFVDVFPKGRHGMYDSRSIKIQPAMYIRWIINQNNPCARRNIQYLFSAVHNKDVRAIDSGIFTSVNTTKIPNMNANDLINNVHTNQKKYTIFLKHLELNKLLISIFIIKA